MDGEGRNKINQSNHIVGCCFGIVCVQCPLMIENRSGSLCGRAMSERGAREILQRSVVVNLWRMISVGRCAVLPISLVGSCCHLTNAE